MKTEMKVLILLGALAAMPALAQVYRWVDEKGTVHYSNARPPAGVKARQVDVEARPGDPSPDTKECYTVRCQGERLEQRLARREAAEARDYAERIANTPRPPRGLDFRAYTSLYRGMSEAEMLTITGAPDLVFSDVFADRRYSYLPTAADPFTTTITVIGGRINNIERVRKF